ncbi:MAG: hypothetical protein ABSE95_00805 [Thermodesulfobacteriota bacterium]|jgi:hypothetical protein
MGKPYSSRSLSNKTPKIPYSKNDKIYRTKKNQEVQITIGFDWTKKRSRPHIPIREKYKTTIGGRLGRTKPVSGNRKKSEWSASHIERFLVKFIPRDGTVKRFR